VREVFAYGTLLSGEPNHSILEVLLGKTQFVGTAITKPEFRMFTQGWFPYVTWERKVSSHAAVAHKNGYPIHGEVYSVDAATLASLDRLEGVPHHYVREQIEVTMTNEGATINPSGQSRAVDIYLYLGDTSRLREITSGNWKENKTTGSAD